MPEEAPVRRILHCDMDCFYAAVHMRDDPSLVGRPVVVGGDPHRRGVVAAASYEARRYGIHSAMPAAVALRRCPEAVFLRPDFRRYRAESERIFSIYREITPLVQTLALDEAYLDVTVRLATWGSGTAVAEAIRRRVHDATGLTVSIGVAPSKLVAKIASDHGKPDGLTVVGPRRVAAFLDPLPVRRLHGVGPASEAALATMDVHTVADLRRLSLDRLIERFGYWGRTLFHYARGVDPRPVRTHAERKSLSTERTFEVDLRRQAEIDAALEEMSEDVSLGLRRRNIAACTVTVKARYPSFETVTRSHTLRVPTTSAGTVRACALRLVRRTDAARRAVRLLGVAASSLVPGDLEQLALFEETAGEPT